MKKPLIAIDIDDTIADSTESLRLLVNRRTERSLPASAYRVAGEYWGYYERIWEAHDIAHLVSHDDFAAEMIDDQSHVPLLPGALFAMSELGNNYRIVFITARDQSWEDATKRWFAMNLPDLDTQVYFTTAHRDANGKTKGQICRELGASVLIDDNVDHCKSAYSEGVEAILFGEYGWQHAVEPRMVRCKDWPAVLEYLSRDR